MTDSFDARGVKVVIATHTLPEQLALLRATHAVELALLQKRQSQDQCDILTAFDADTAWSHARTGKGWDAGV